MTKEVFAFPASFAQERLWFLTQMDPGDPAYHIAGAVRFKGSLNVAVLQESFNEIVRRHESLRTTFKLSASSVMQIVSSEGEVRLELVSVETCAEGATGGDLSEKLSALARQPFELEAGPLLRVVLLRSAADDHTLLLVIHHISADGWSLMVLIKEVMAFYKALVSGSPVTLSALPIQYPDYTQWQKQWVSTGSLQTAVEYWKRKLANLQATVLPTDYMRPLVPNHVGARRSLQLCQSLSEDLLHLCQREQTTLFMMLLAAFNVLLYRHTGADEIVLGTPVAGRKRVELEPLIGCFVNTLVLRTQIPAQASFLDLLRQVRDVALEAYSYEDVPFETVLAAVNAERTGTQAPLFHIFFNMLSFPEALAIELPDVQAEFVEVPETSSKFDLTLYVAQKNGTIRFDLVYDVELYGEERIAAVLNQYECLLKQISRHPDTRVDSLSLVTPEAQWFLPDLTVSFDSQWRGGVHDLFRSQAESGPERIAVADPHVTWTYGQLDAISNRIANYLLSIDVQRQDVVAIYGHRSAPLVPSLLGIMKAGSAFLILDPAYPPARLVDYLIIARPKALLHLAGAGALPNAIRDFIAVSTCSVLVLPPGEASDFEESIRSFSDVAPEVTVLPDDLAYLAFTSGSTGKPKGVLGGHRSLSHFAPWLAERFCLTPSDRFSLLSGLAHDPLHRDVFLALMTGAAVVIPDADGWQLPGKAMQWIQENKISVMNLTPAIGQLIRSDATSLEPPLDSLRYIFFVGDALTREDVHAFQRLAPGVTCVNLYGATETQQALGHYVIGPEGGSMSAVAPECAARRKGIVPLGQGLKDVQLLVVNKSRQLCGVGEVGEIYFRSPHLAQGYLHDPELTAEKFVRNWAIPAGTHNNNDSDRLYKTGDLGRYLPSGDIESVGRADYQVKIRGFRVELEEIEAVLKQHPGTQSAAVISREDETGSRSLAAYVVLSKENQNWERELFRFLSERLPSYMIPASFLAMEALPLLPTGKIDRRALAKLDAPRIERDPQRTAEQEDEEILAGIFAAALKRKHVGVDENFFEAGGHSLLTIQVLSRVREIFAVELPQRAMFDTPTVTGLVQQIRAARRMAPEVPAIKALSRNQALPLSFAQQRLWFLERLQPGSTAYNMLFGIRLSGELHKQALQRSLNEIVQRHEVLRTTFHDQNGVPAQKIKDHVDLQIEEIKLDHLPIAERKHEVQRQRWAESKRPFDLEVGPLLRVRLIQLEDQEYVVLMTMHHMVGDAWSTGVVIHELSHLYEAYCEGKAATLAALPIQYADYAVWQREWLHGEVLERQLRYWRKQLEAITTLQLPLDRRRPPLMSQKAAVVDVGLRPELSEELKTLALHEGVTLFMILLAAWQLLLARYSGQQDVAIGVPIAGRTRSELSGLIGFFVNTLVLRSHVGDQSSFRKLLHQVRERCLEAYDHQDVPFEKLVEELQPERDLSRQPFFQVMFGLQTTPRQELQLPGLRLSPLLQEDNVLAAKFDLTLLVAETQAGIQGRLEYVPDLFEKSTAETLIRRWQLVLEQITDDPKRTVASISLMSQAERAQLTTGWTGAAVESRGDQTMGALVSGHAEHNQQAVALVEDRRELTYDVLNRHANQWAHYLIKDGVVPGTRVLVCLERVADLLPVSLGVLKCGGILAGVDPTEPSIRLKSIVELSEAAVVITSKRLAESFPATAARLLSVDEQGAEVAQQSAQDPNVEVDPDSPACVVYRSGAAGPSGVLIRHAALATLESTANPSEYEIREFDRVAFRFAFAHEGSSLQLFRTLARGACVVSLPAQDPLPPRKLASLLRDQRVSVLVTLRPLLERVAREFPLALKGVRLVLCEESAEILAQLRSSLNPDLLERVCGMCACSEAGGSWLNFALASMTAESRVRVNHLAAGNTMYLLDSAMEPVPDGVLGEIYLSGHSVALGYDHEGPQTALSFLPDPYSTLPGTRMYRTGDWAWRCPDGTLEFRGRHDDRTMTGGVRVHTEEIQAALLQHPDVGEVAVIRYEPSEGEAELVAIVVAAAGVQMLAQDLLRFLEPYLPETMRPKRVIQTERIPRSHDGGVDRLALQKLVTEQSSGAVKEYVAPRNQVEGQLAAIWARIFAVDHVGVHDNFFRLGGHSLLATQVVAHINDALHVELPLRRLFEAPTVAELARVVAQLIIEEAPGRTPPITRVPRDQPLPLSFAQQRLWFLDQLEPGSAAYNLRVAIRLIGDMNREALGWSLQEILRRHESLRTSFAAPDGNAIQIIAADLKLDLEEIDLRGNSHEQQESELGRLARLEAVTPFDLTRAPLLRVKLLRLNDRESALLVTMHHIVSDGWSMGIMVREFCQLYAACVLGQASPLPELALQYADYAVWQRTWLQGEVLERQVAYWRKQLADVPLLELPADRPRPPAMSPRGASIGVSLNAELTEKLKTLSRNHGVTLFMTLLASFQLLLSRYSGQSDVAVGTPIAGRTRTDTEGLIGFFINTLVLRARIDEQSSFRSLLAHVREGTLAAYEHQDVPFEKLVDELEPERDLSRQPFFQVMFALQDASQEELQLPGLRLARIQSRDDAQTSKFDLTMLLDEGARAVEGSLEYTPDLFDETTIETMVQRWQLILEQVVEDAGTPVSHLSILREGERQLLCGWSGRDGTDSSERVDILVARHAERRPQATAIVAEGQELSWHTLDRRANQWAHYLKKHGVVPATQVGVCLRNIVDLAVTSIAVLRCGGVLVGLDPHDSPAHLAMMLESSQAVLVIAEKRSSEIFSRTSVLLVLVDEERAEVAKEDEGAVHEELGADSLACILYRSSPSAGPVGIMLTHRLLSGPGFNESDRILQPIGFSADVAATELFQALASGACVIDAPNRPALAPRKFANLIREQKVTVLRSSAVMLERLAREFPSALKSLRQIACDADNSVQNWLKHVLSNEILERVRAVYGCDEAGGKWMTYPLGLLSGATLPRVTPDQFKLGSHVHLLDSYLEPVPEGVIGEIYLGSESLALGYQLEPRLTAGRFVPDPFANVGGARLYRTGEWARRRADGGLDLCGRRDGRMLIDGIRVEAEEVETVLAQHPTVRDVAVVMHGESGEQDADLVAVVAAVEGQSVSGEDLADFGRAKLPESMMPRAFVQVERIPRNIEGGIDRRAVARVLRKRDAAIAAPEYEAPRNEIEKILCSVWEEVLSVAKVGVNDNFFRLGGDSILSIQVIARARQAGVGLMPRQIFEKQTIAELAAVAGKVATTIAEQGEVTGEASLAPFQREFFQWELARPNYFNQSVLLGLDPGADTRLLEQAVLGLLRQHDALRTRFVRTEQGWQQIYEPAGPDGIYDRRDLASLEESEQRAALERDAMRAQSSLDLSTGRLIKAVEYDLGMQRGKRLLLVVHHLVVDGVSWRILVEDLERGYTQLGEGKEIALGSKTTSFKQWTERLDDYADEDRVTRELEYWTRQSRKKAGRVPLDLGESRSSNLFATQKNVIAHLTEEETRALLQDVPGVYNTQINDVLLTALARVLGQWSGSEAVVVDLEGHGREEIFPDVDLSRTVGWFTITYPVVLEAGREPGWHPGKALSRIKEQLRTVPNRGLGYGVLRHMSKDRRIRERMSEMPIPEIIFNYLGQVDQVLRKSELLAPAAEGSGVAIALENQRPYILDVSGVVLQGRLQMNWSYSDRLHRREQLEEIATRYMECLRELINHCRSEEAGGFTPSDFPVAEMTQKELAQIASLLGK